MPSISKASCVFKLEERKVLKWIRYRGYSTGNRRWRGRREATTKMGIAGKGTGVRGSSSEDLQEVQIALWTGAWENPLDNLFDCSVTLISEPSAVFPVHISAERERGKVQGAILMELFGIQRWDVWNNECSVLGTSFELVWSAFKCIHILFMLFFFSIWFFESVFDFFECFCHWKQP